MSMRPDQPGWRDSQESSRPSMNGSHSYDVMMGQLLERTSNNTQELRGLRADMRSYMHDLPTRIVDRIAASRPRKRKAPWWFPFDLRTGLVVLALIASGLAGIIESPTLKGQLLGASSQISSIARGMK